MNQQFKKSGEGTAPCPHLYPGGRGTHPFTPPHTPVHPLQDLEPHARRSPSPLIPPFQNPKYATDHDDDDHRENHRVETVDGPYVIVSVGLSPCPRSKRKTARAINTKLDGHTVHGSRSTCIDPEVKKSKVKVTRLPRSRRGMHVGRTA